MKIKDAYHYFFYKLYKFYESSPWKWWSEWKAGLTITVLMVFILMSISGYFLVATHIDLGDSLFVWILVALGIEIINYKIFYSHRQWKKYNSEFNRWPKKRNRIGSWIVFIVVLFIFSNLVFMFYLMSRTGWKITNR